MFSQRRLAQIGHDIREMLLSRCFVLSSIVDEAAKSSHLPLNTSHSITSLPDQHARLVNGLKYRKISQHFYIKINAFRDSSLKRHILKMKFIVFVDVSERNILTQSCVDTSGQVLNISSLCGPTINCYIGINL